MYSGRLIELFIVNRCVVTTCAQHLIRIGFELPWFDFSMENEE